MIADGAGVVDRDDVGVRNMGDRPRLPQQARAPVRLGGGEFADDLQRDPPVQVRVVRGVDLAHAAAPDRAQDLVARNLRPRRQPPDERARFGRAVGVSVVGARQHQQFGA